MKTRRLGKTGLQVSVIGLGTWQFGGEWGKSFAPSEVDALIGRARDLGINLIDTAECYGNHLSESLIGNAIARDRGAWILATKFGHHYHGHLQRTDHWKPQEVVAQLERSLKALRTDYIDLYQFHSGSDAEFDQDALWEVLERQVRAGKIRHLGNSVADNRAPYQTSRAADVGVSVIQVVYNRLDRAPEEAILPLAKAQDLGVLAREPLANGLLSGKYLPGSTLAEPADWRSQGWQSDAVQDRLRRVAQIGATELPPGMNLASWALAWCLRDEAVTAVIPGCKSLTQLEANAAAAALELAL